MAKKVAAKAAVKSSGAKVKEPVVESAPEVVEEVVEEDVVEEKAVEAVIDESVDAESESAAEAVEEKPDVEADNREFERMVMSGELESMGVPMMTMDSEIYDKINVIDMNDDRIEPNQSAFSCDLGKGERVESLAGINGGHKEAEKVEYLGYLF